MKVLDSIVLFGSGLAVWVVGTIYYAYRGTAVLESSSLRYWISFFVSPIVSAAICIAILRRTSRPSCRVFTRPLPVATVRSCLPPMPSS